MRLSIHWVTTTLLLCRTRLNNFCDISRWSNLSASASVWVMSCCTVWLKWGAKLPFCLSFTPFAVVCLIRSTSSRQVTEKEKESEGPWMRCHWITGRNTYPNSSTHSHLEACPVTMPHIFRRCKAWKLHVFSSWQMTENHYIHL